MAEFQEVMHQIARLCAVTPCSENCPLESECMNLAQAAEPIHAERIERIVMKWAKEHPEPVPVYPTYGEWFVEHGDLVDGWQNATNVAWMANTASSIFTKPIPADIAQKLGIEPKWESKKRPSE